MPNSNDDAPLSENEVRQLRAILIDEDLHILEALSRRGVGDPMSHLRENPDEARALIESFAGGINESYFGEGWDSSDPILEQRRQHSPLSHAMRQASRFEDESGPRRGALLWSLFFFALAGALSQAAEGPQGAFAVLAAGVAVLAGIYFAFAWVEAGGRWK